MNLEPVQSKQLTQIEHLTKQLLLALSESELGDDVTTQELVVLAIETGNERKLRSRAEVAQQAKDTANRLNTWENEGGNTGVQSPGRPLERLHRDTSGNRRARH